MTAHFELQPVETELQHLADEYWQQCCNRERQLEAEAFDAGKAIRNGEYTLTNLEAIVRWKSERLVHYLIGNGSLRIRRALEVAALPESSTREAMMALLELKGVDVPMASAILACIYPDRYMELDYQDLGSAGAGTAGRALLRRVPGVLPRIGGAGGGASAERTARANTAAHAGPGAGTMGEEPGIGGGVSGARIPRPKIGHRRASTTFWRSEQSHRCGRVDGDADCGRVQKCVVDQTVVHGVLDSGAVGIAQVAGN